MRLSDVNKDSGFKANAKAKDKCHCNCHMAKAKAMELRYLGLKAFSPNPRPITQDDKVNVQQQYLKVKGNNDHV